MKQVTKNFLSLASSEVVRKALAFFSVAYLARHLTLAGFGLVSLGLTVLSYSITISSAGLSLFGIRQIAKGEDTAFVGRLTSLRLVTAAVVFVLTAGLTILVVHDPLTVRLIILFNCSLFAYALLLEWFYQGRESMHTVSFGKSVTAAIYLVLILLLVRSDNDLLWVAIAAVAGDFAMMLFYAVKYRAEGRALVVASDVGEWKRMTLESLPLGLGTILGHISVNLAPLVLAILMTNVEVGLYSAASKLVVFLLLIDRVLGILLLPASARLQAHSPQQLALRLAEAMKWILIVALPLCVGGMLVATDLIRMVFGEGFIASAGLFRILVWFLCLTMIHTVYSSGLVAVAPSSVYGKVMTISAVVYTLALVVLTKMYGLYGTVFGVVLSEGITLLIARSRLRPHVRIVPAVATHGILAALLAMSFVVVYLQPVHLFIRVAVGALVYGSVILLARVCTLNEIAALVWRKSS
ncbi:MAG TPA: flippase [Bacteroidota bacterium]|nr:flippase [Bacteroidota bacterium]